MSLESILKIYVDRNSKVVNVEWNPELSIENPFDYKENPAKTAHHMLLIASVTETFLTGRAENARALLHHLYNELGEELYLTKDEEQLGVLVESCTFYPDFGPERYEIPDTIVSVNKYVESAGGDLIEYAENFEEPAELVKGLGRIKRMEGFWEKKAWMYTQWCTRPHPDLGLFENFSPSDLRIPITSYIIDVAKCLDLVKYKEPDWITDPGKRSQVQHDLTELGKKFYPEDPCRISYPFYLLGRWIRGKPLNKHTLLSHLEFFDRLYRQTGTVPVIYDIVSTMKSGLEKRLSHELSKLKIVYYYESNLFPLTEGIVYTPDFVMPRVIIQGRKVVLEPHGVWDPLRKRRVRVGRRSIQVDAAPSRVSLQERNFTNKLRTFRKLYGEQYHLILIAPPRQVNRIERNYPKTYDQLYPINDIPKMLYELPKDNQQFN
jgi:hypothetical protein